MEKYDMNGICAFSGDRDTEVAVVLIHGYIRNEVGKAVHDLIGSYSYTECYLEGGYMLTVATNTDDPLDILQGMDIISCIYNHEEDIPDTRPNTDAPIFEGIQPAPYELTIEDYYGDEWVSDGLRIYFVAGIHGYDIDGYARYED